MKSKKSDRTKMLKSHSKTASREIKNTKRNLRTMSKNGKHHKIRSASRITKYGIKSFGRNIWLSIAAILIMTITLAILLVTVIAMNVLNSTAQEMREKVDITIFLKPTAAQADVDYMTATLRANDNVKELVYTSAEEAKATTIAENQDSKDPNVIKIINSEDFQNKIAAKSVPTIRLNVYDIDRISDIKSLVSTDPTFQANLHEEASNPDSAFAPTYDSQTDQVVIDRISSWANIAQYGGLVLSVIFLTLSVLVIFNTIRMAIFSRREEIYMMKLVGADNTFIRGPFLIEAELCGVISGILATSLGVLLFHFIKTPLANYGISVATPSLYLETPRVIIVYLITIALGMLIATISSYLAVHKYLRK